MTTERGYPWLKLWSTYGEDPRFLRLSDVARARYWDFYILAGKADAAGLIMLGNDVATVEDLAFILRREIKQVQEAINELVNASLLSPENGGWSITRFVDEQGPSMAEKREQWKERQMRKRSKLPGNAIEKDQDKDKEEDKEVTRESRVTHHTHTPPSAVGPSSEDLIAIWEEETGLPADKKRAGKIVETLRSWGLADRYYGITARQRLRSVVSFWEKEREEAGKRGLRWGRVNPEAILERFPIPGLERAIQELGFTFGTEEAEKARMRVLEDWREVA